MYFSRYSRILPLIVLLLACLLLTACGKQSDTDGSGNGATSWYTVRIFPDQGGWAITSRGILHTDDNGNTWHIVTPPDLQGYASFASLPFSFWNSQVIWLASTGQTQYVQYGQKQTPDPAHTYHSVDGGKSWLRGDIPDTTGTYSDIRSTAGFLLHTFQQLQPQGENRTVIGIHSISAIDPQHAWISVSCQNWHTGGGQESVSLVYLRLWKTADGGKSWQKQWENTDKNYPYYGSFWAYFLTPTTALRGTTLPINMLLSHDKGQNWQQKVLPRQLSPQVLQVSTLEQPTFFDTSHGVVNIKQFEPNQHYRYYPFVTSDGGQNWQAAAPLELPSARSSTQISYLDSAHWIASGTGMLSLTSDGGAHWQQFKLAPDIVTITSFSFVTVEEGWGISQQPASGTNLPNPTTLVHTVDGGRTWKAVNYKIVA